MFCFADLPGHFHGISHYGDNIEDEWFIVALLYEITRQIPNLIVRVEDSDGEFMLIEAADHLPGWATPEKCANKLYILNGHLHMIQRQENISMAEAVTELRQNPTKHKATAAIENSVQSRIKGYSDGHAVKCHQHRANAFVPLPVARLLHRNPNWVAASVQAFCNRDPIDLKTIRAMKFFPPENRVYAPIQFSKCLYAMLLHQQYLPDRRTGWQLPPKTHADHREAVLGMRLACGFEILVANAQKRGQAAFDEGNKHWMLYLAALTQKGYFKGLLEGSKEYERLKEAAKEYFLLNEANDSRWTTEVGAEILQQLRELSDEEEEIKFPVNKSELPPSEDDQWLEVDAADLDRMMKERYKGGRLEDLDLLNEEGEDEKGSNLAAQLEKFLKMKSDYEGVEEVDGAPMETGEQRGQPKKEVKAPSTTAIDFDPEMFATHVKNLLDFVIPEDDTNWHSDDSGEMSDYDEDGEGGAAGQRGDVEQDMKEGKMRRYMNMMDKELKGTTVGKSFVEGEGETKREDTETGEFDDIEEFRPVNIERNALKNMVESYQSQLGGPGPTSNLLSSMGFNVKRGGGGVRGEEDEVELKEATV